MGTQSTLSWKRKRHPINHVTMSPVARSEYNLFFVIVEWLFEASANSVYGLILKMFFKKTQRNGKLSSSLTN